MKIKLLYALAVLSFGATSTVGASEAGRHAAFFADVKTGRSITQLPAGMPDPAVIAHRFEAEIRDNEWAATTEADIGRAMSSPADQTAISRQITCKRHICEVLAIFAAPSEYDVHQIQSALHGRLGQVASANKQELTMAIGGDVADELAVLAFLHRTSG